MSQIASFKFTLDAKIWKTSLIDVTTTKRIIILYQSFSKKVCQWKPDSRNQINVARIYEADEVVV